MADIKSIRDLRFNFDNYIVKIVLYIVTIVLLITFAVVYLLANYTTVLEEFTFALIATTDGYNYTYDGEYFRLQRKDENGSTINILYRYDEENFSTYVDKHKSENNGLYVVKKDTNGKIQSENNIMFNIENEFNDFKLKHTLGYGGGYTLQSIHSVFDFHRIIYKSNLPTDRIDILKNIVELEPIDTSSIIYYHGDEETFADSIEKEYLDKKRRELFKKGYRDAALDNMIEKEKYRYELINRKDKLSEENSNKTDASQFVYSTYNMIVLAPESEQHLIKKSDNNNYVRNNTGVIIGCCINDADAISDMRWTIYKIEVMTLLEKTSLL